MHDRFLATVPRGLGLVLVIASLAGCASLRGSARPVTPVDTRLAYAAEYPEAKVYSAFFQSSDSCGQGQRWPECRAGLSRVEFRNMVSALYMSAADARYEEFRSALSREAKGSAFGGNIGVLLMNGVSVVSGTEARRALAAASAVVAGGQASVSKDLFIEKALPAVLAAMDANRLEHKTAIVTNLRLDATRYSLPQALADIRRLEEQARLDEAVQRLTTNATVDAAKNRQKLDVAYTVALQGPLVARKSALLDDIEALDAAKQGEAAEKLGATRNADPAIQTGLLRVWIDQNVQSEQAFDEVVKKLKPLTGKDSYP